MDRQSIQHTRDLRIGSVMNYIFISFDITLIVVNRPLKLCFKQSYQFILSAYKLRNLSAVITGRPNLIHDFHFVMILGANRNIRFTWRNFGFIFKLNVSVGTWKRHVAILDSVVFLPVWFSSRFTVIWMVISFPS